MYYLKGVGYFGKLNNALGLGDLAAIKTYDQAITYAKGAIKVIDSEIANIPAEKHGPYLTAKQRYSNAKLMATKKHYPGRGGLERSPLEQVVKELEAADRFYDEVIGKGKTSPAWGIDPKTGQTLTTPPPANAIVPGAPSDATVSKPPGEVKKNGSKNPRKIPWMWAGIGVGAFTLLTLLWLNHKKKTKNPWAAVLPRGFYTYDKPAEALRKAIELQHKGQRARFSEFPFPEETRKWMLERERET